MIVVMIVVIAIVMTGENGGKVAEFDFLLFSCCIAIILLWFLSMLEIRNRHF